jgi:tetratricopeptide (TPR) repeat protein
LRAYEDRFQDTFFLFPVTPMDCIRRLSDLSDGCLLVISADKGYTREADLQGRDELGIAVHGSFSVTVNYHALGEYVAKQGGVALHSSHHSDNLGVSAFVLGIGPDSIIETRQAYATAIEGFGPDDFYALKKGMEQIYDTLTTPQIISYLRLSGWDANILLGCTPTLLDRVDSLSEPERQDLSEAIRQVWEMYYPIGEEGDLPFHMGVLLYGMGYCADALTYFRRSLDLHGQDPSTLYNVGMSHYCLHQLEDALEYIDRALAIVPGAEEFRAMRDEIEQDIRRRKSTGPQ